jgi:N-acetylglucosaminyl-diphospho-decaprenol L-rhamnosyltransferase
MTEPQDAVVSIVIPTLDAGDMLTDCLIRVGANRDGIDVIIVDNGSTDGSVERALAAFPAADVVRNSSNRGYAPACNQGAALARAGFILFLNSDASMSAQALDHLLEVASEDTTTAIWQPVTLTSDGALESTGDHFTWWGINRHLEDVPHPREGERSAEVFATVGAALLVRRSIFGELGGFEDSYFAYYEESDLCWRARLSGHEVRVVPGALIEHIGSATTGRIFEPHAVRYLSFRNRIRTNLSNPSGASLVRIAPLHLLACLAFVGLYAITGRLRSSAAVLQAMWWTVGNRDVWSEQRARVQSARKRPDTEVLRPDLVTSFGPRTLWRHLQRSYWFERAADRDVSDRTRRN